VEDQQPAEGDLTDKAGEDETEVTEVTAVPAAEAAAESQAAEADSDDSGESGEARADEAEADADTAAVADDGERRPRRRRLGRRWLTVVAAAVLLFVGSAAFAGATLKPYLTDRATTATKLRVARTAANAITTLWTYTPENMDGLADRAQAYLSGDFAAQYRKFVDAIVAPNKQAKISNNTEVAGVGIESLDDQNAVAIVYTNTTSTSPLTKNIPSLKYLSYRLFLKRNEGRWLVTRMTTITSLDLTPRV
jgi:Mce-associated membrane protein